VPELQKAVEQARAALEQAKAMVKVAEAKLSSAKSMKKAAEAMLAQRKAEVAAKTSYREYRYKQEERIRGLVQRNAVEEKLLDEAIDQYEAAVGDEKAAQAAVLTAESDVAAKQAQIEQAQADVIDANAQVGVAQANLEKAQVMENYTKITSPYDGVITLRSFHRGDFIRSASEGGAVALLAVARTDLMRVVIPVPDTQVPFVDRNDQATIVVDALPGRQFHAPISRFSESEDPANRAMRTEVDLPNPDGKLREGMYGQATILLEPAPPKAVRVPSSSLLRLSAGGEGEVYVVRDGKAHKVTVHIGMDNGNEAEILAGLTPDDLVIVRYNGALSEGTPVVPEEIKPKSGPAQPAKSAA
jgi:RND family efflux transporter MFP subunit